MSGKTARNRALDFLFTYGAIIVIGLVMLYFSLASPYFLTYDNLKDILRAISIVTFVAIGITLSQIVDGFDLSVGSTVSLSAVVSATLMVWYEQPLWLTLLVPVIVGVAVGAINSFLIIKLRIPDLLATLAVMYLIGGLHRTYTAGRSIHNNMLMPDGTKAPGRISESFLWIGQGSFLGLPVPVWLMLISVVGMHIFLVRTRWGRQLYITGGNREAARLAGIRVDRIRVFAYMLSGVFAALAGILFTARVGSGSMDAGAPLLMEAVAAVFVGYSVLGAGKPNVIGTFVGAVLIGVLLNGLTMQNMPYYAYDIVKGAVLVFALAATFIHVRANLRK